MANPPKFRDPTSDLAGLDRLPDAHVLGCTLYGEARGSTVSEILAVGEVIMSRVNDGRYGRGIRGVCFKRLAFSCWWEVSTNRDMTLRVARCLLYGTRFETLGDTTAWRKIAALLPGLIDEVFPFQVEGCLHYHTIPNAAPSLFPKWARGKTPANVLGPFKFYSDIDAPAKRR